MTATAKQTRTRSKTAAPTADAAGVPEPGAPLPVEAAPPTPPPAEPAPVGPDIQSALAAAPINPGASSDPQAGKTGDPQTIAVIDLCAELGACISRQTGELLTFLIERGRIVADIINASLCKARNDATRKNQRAGALRTAELTALGTYDADAESKPDPDRWHRLYRLAQLFPEARALPGPTVADKFTALLTRVDPPARWDAPEEWTLKPQFQADAVRAMLARAAEERFTKDDATAAIDELLGAKPEPPKAKAQADNVKTAKQTAKRIMDQITEGKIHPETLFDELTALLTRYGWRLTIGKDANGQPTIKPHKIERNDVIQLPTAANA